MRNTILWGTVAAVAALAGSFAAVDAPASALGESGTLSFQIHPNWSSNYPEGNAGEFQISTLTGQTAILATQPAAFRAGGSYFQTFCGQLSEDAFGGYFYTWTLDVKFNGTDPLLNTTAFLYQQFFDGSLPNYDYVLGPGRSATAKSVQLAIWKLQNQLFGTFIGYYDADAGAQAYVAYAIANAPADIGNVRVLVLNEGLETRQDLLAIETRGRSGTPGLKLEKVADDDLLTPGQPVTYHYTVTNIGTVTVTNITVKDDNGTPGDPSDDFTVGTIASLDPGQADSTTLFKTLIPPIPMCDPVQFADGEPVGTLSVTEEPACWRIRYTQSLDVNDNSYGTTQSANWLASNHSHSFSNLTGSDKCQFRVKAKNGAVVLDMFEDYISAKANGKSGYETLGGSGGDGSFVVGNASNLKGFDTSLSRTINQSPAFYGFTTNSPLGATGTSTPAGWEWVNWYEICVDKALFTAANGGFGGVEIPSLHNSPPLTAQGAVYPKPCDVCITNIASAKGTYVDADGISFLIASNPASETVCIDVPASQSYVFGVADVQLKTKKFDRTTLYLELTNKGTAPAIIKGLDFTWPNGATENKKLKTITTAKVIYNTLTATSPLVTTTFVEKVAHRTIAAGATLKLIFTFEATAKTDMTKYALKLDFGKGYQTFLP